jgi:hypothetical protein
LSIHTYFNFNLSTSVENPKVKVSMDVQFKDLTPYTLGLTKNPQSDKATIEHAEKLKMKHLGGVLFSYKGDEEKERKSFKYPSKDMPNFAVVVKENIMSVCVPPITKKDLDQMKQFDASFSARVNIGNYVYNGMAMTTGAFETMSYNAYQLNNLSTSYLETGFQTRQHLSDYYVENASFLKMDNLTLGYNFGEVFKGCNLNVSAMVQNVFCITRYSGVDPEVPNGVDNTFYPRPRTYSLNIGLNF